MTDQKKEKNHLPCYVINLDQDQEKWQTIQEQFKKEQVSLTRFPAYLGKEHREHADVHPLLQLFGTDTMIGCGLSHRQLWKKIVDQQIPEAIILEDDTAPIEKFLDCLKQVKEQLPADYDLLYLHYYSFDGNLLTSEVRDQSNFPSTSEPIEVLVDEKFKIYRIKTAATTCAYLVSLQGAQKLLNLINQVKFHIDAQMSGQMILYKDLQVYAVRPPLVEPYFEETSNAHSYLVHQWLPSRWQWLLGMTYAQIPFIQWKISVWNSIVIPVTLFLSYQYHLLFLNLFLLLL